MLAFSDALDECGLHDVTSRGYRYTWCNKRKGDDTILARLDRYVCNYEWNFRFPAAKAENLAYFGSDHRQVSLVLKPDPFPNLRKVPKRFTFEHKCLIE